MLRLLRTTVMLCGVASVYATDAGATPAPSPTCADTAGDGSAAAFDACVAGTNHLKSNLGDVTCATDTCDAGDCCDANPTCANAAGTGVAFTCTAAFTSKTGTSPTCATDTCDASDCCDACSGIDMSSKAGVASCTQCTGLTTGDCTVAVCDTAAHYNTGTYCNPALADDGTGADATPGCDITGHTTATKGECLPGTCAIHTCDACVLADPPSCTDTNNDGLEDTCTDSIKNGDETGVDAGGTCTALPCTGAGYTGDTDGACECATGYYLAPATAGDDAPTAVSYAGGVLSGCSACNNMGTVPSVASCSACTGPAAADCTDIVCEEHYSEPCTAAYTCLTGRVENTCIGDPCGPTGALCTTNVICENDADWNPWGPGGFSSVENFQSCGHWVKALLDNPTGNGGPLLNSGSPCSTTPITDGSSSLSPGSDPVFDMSISPEFPVINSRYYTELLGAASNPSDCHYTCKTCSSGSNGHCLTCPNGDSPVVGEDADAADGGRCNTGVLLPGYWDCCGGGKTKCTPDFSGVCHDASEYNGKNKAWGNENRPTNSANLEFIEGESWAILAETVPGVGYGHSKKHSCDNMMGAMLAMGAGTRFADVGGAPDEDTVVQSSLLEADPAWPTTPAAACGETEREGLGLNTGDGTERFRDNVANMMSTGAAECCSSMGSVCENPISTGNLVCKQDSMWQPDALFEGTTSCLAAQMYSTAQGGLQSDNICNTTVTSTGSSSSQTAGILGPPCCEGGGNVCNPEPKDVCKTPTLYTGLKYVDPSIEGVVTPGVFPANAAGEIMCDADIYFNSAFTGWTPGRCGTAVGTGQYMAQRKLTNQQLTNHFGEKCCSDKVSACGAIGGCKPSLLAVAIAAVVGSVAPLLTAW